MPKEEIVIESSPAKKRGPWKILIIILIVLLLLAIIAVLSFSAYKYIAAPKNETNITSTNANTTQNNVPVNPINNTPISTQAKPNCTDRKKNGDETGIDCGGSCKKCATVPGGDNPPDSCTPNCAGKNCGSDGCGGSCGSCNAGYSCVSGQCIQAVSNLINIAPYASITSTPYTSLLSRMVDGDPGTGVIPESNDYVENITYEFRFNEAVPVSKISFSLPLMNFILLADTTGSEVYDTQLYSKNETGEVKLTLASPGVITIPWDYEDIDGAVIRFTNNSDTLPSPLLFNTNYFLRPVAGRNYTLYDTRANALNGTLDGQINTSGSQSGIYLGTVLIGYWYVPKWGYWVWTPNTPKSIYAVKLITPRNSPYIYDFQIWSESNSINPNLISPITLEPGVPTVSPGSVVSVAAPSIENQYLKGVYIEPWNLDWNGWITSSPRGNLRDWPAYKNMLATVRGVGANMLWMMPIRAGEDCYRGPVPWPSNYIKDSSPENYLAMLATALHADGIKIFAGDRPYPGWIPKEGIDPGSGNRPLIPGGVAEMAASGIDGVAVCYDEDYGNDPTPYKLAADAAKAANPNVTTFANIAAWNFAGIGNTNNIDFLGTEGYFTKEDAYGHWAPALSTVRTIGANLQKQTIITQGNGWTSIPTDPSDAARLNAYPKVAMYGAILSTVSHGGNAQAFWRLTDFLVSNPEYYNATAKGYSMLDTLAAWGGKNAAVSNEIVVLDQYIVEGGQDSTWSYDIYVNFRPREPWAAETSRNRASERAIYELLLTNGYPFKVGYLEFPDTVPNLSESKVIIIPFPYNNYYKIHINESVINWINEAAASGTKVIILGYPGTVYSGFDALVNSSNVVVLTDNVLYGITNDFKNHFLSSLDSALGINKPTYLNIYGQDIELSSLEKNATEKFLFVTNWENHSATADVGINMPEGNYRMLQRDLNETRNISISGRYILTKQDLAKFRVNMDSGEAWIFYIYPSEISYLKQSETNEAELPSLNIWSWIKGFLTGNTIREITGYFLRIKA